MLDAAYGLMIMGEAEQNFGPLRGVLTEASGRAEQRRDSVAVGLMASLAHMRLTFVVLVSVGSAVSIAAALLIARAISRPTMRLTRIMAARAGGSVDVEIPDRQRRDEIGAMARAVQVFKQTMIDARRLAAEQASAGQAREARAHHVEALAGDFESAIGRLTGAVAAAATEMETTAGAMLSTADQTDQRSATVAAAAEQTSANVRTVAAAADELAASVLEISRQAAQSAKIAGKAVEDARHTDATVQTLLADAQKIGDVVTLIHNIANQTNLLALVLIISRYIRYLGTCLANFTRGIPMILRGQPETVRDTRGSVRVCIPIGKASRERCRWEEVPPKRAGMRSSPPPRGRLMM